MLTTKMIGNKISEARKKMNISQAQLAQRLFISSQAVGKWERGESTPDITTFNRLAEILGVDLNYFSENFSSVATEVVSEKPSVEQPAELSGGIQKHKHSWDMSQGNWKDVDFSGLKNLHEKFSASNMQQVKFIGSDMSGLLLKNNRVDRCDFSESGINNSHIQNSYLSNNLYKGCFLKDTEFTGSYVKRCDFSGADFTGSLIKSSTLLKNTMTNAVWKGTTFHNTQLSEIVFDSALSDCSFENCEFSEVIFRNTVLTHTFFRNNRFKRVQFIDCKADKITYAFLKNEKVDVTGITVITTEKEL